MYTQCFNCLSPLVKEKQSEHYLKCKKCGIVINTAFSVSKYEDTYFTKDYKTQYGKTYEEDFSSIYTTSLKRISRIKKLLLKQYNQKLTCLDIGCALGYFLKAFSDTFESIVEGVEISGYAAQYIEKKYGFTVYNRPFHEFKTTQKYHVITAWFYIEHNQVPEKIMSEIYSLLKPGGVFAFSLPSSFGPLYKYNRNKWIETHPSDHSVDFTPGAIKNILMRIGFKKVNVVPSSYHPERVLSGLHPLFPVFSFFYKIYSRLFCFSDTIEIYCKK